MIKALVLLMSIIALTAKQNKSLKFKDANFNFGGQSLKVSGVINFSEDMGKVDAYQYCMDMDTMTPYAMLLVPQKSKHDGNVIKAKCSLGKWGIFSEGSLANGEAKFTIDGNKISVEINCRTQSRGEWIISVSGQNSKYSEYEYKEAGLRAKSLIGQDLYFYKGPTIATYAAIGDPKSVKCDVLDMFGAKAQDAKPGYFIIGNDKRHCGILDNEGTKFIHDNTNENRVTDTPIVMAKQFFPNGYYFIKYRLSPTT